MPLGPSPPSGPYLSYFICLESSRSWPRAATITFHVVWGKKTQMDYSKALSASLCYTFPHQVEHMDIQSSYSFTI